MLENKKNLIKGIVWTSAGAAIGLAIPIWFGTSTFKFVDSRKNFNQSIEEIKNTTQYQQVYKRDEEILEEKYNNKELTTSEYSEEKGELGSIDYVMNYINNNLPDEYEGFLKTKNKNTGYEISFGIASIVMGVQFVFAPALGLIAYWHHLDEKNNSDNNIEEDDTSLKDFVLGSMNLPLTVGTIYLKNYNENKKNALKPLKKEPDDLPVIDLE